jgi:hypothetical protein
VPDDRSTTTIETVMARKRSKVSVSTETNTYRLSANERREARFAEISNKQADLKREAAERGAKRANESKAKDSVGEAPVPHEAAGPERSHPG